jgi:amino acid transporter
VVTRTGSDPPIPPAGARPPGARSLLGVWDGISVVVGIVVGVSLFRVPGPVFASIDAPWQGMAVWALGGALSLVGALCYAELAAAYPRAGGDYEYLTRAFGPATGFLFGWAQLVAVMSGSIGALAFVFADYARVLWPGANASGLAAAVVVALTLPNLLGLGISRGMQNALTLVKVAGLAGIVIAALAAPAPPAGTGGAGRGGLGFALILVLYAYGGWNHAAFVAAEIHEPQRNVPRVLVLGTAAVATLYLLVNLAYLHALGFPGLRASQAPAADVLAAVAGRAGAAVISILVMTSALGAIQGMVFTAARIYASVGRDHPALAALAPWHPRFGTPTRALLAQSAVALAWIASVGTSAGRGALDAALSAVGLPVLPWQRFGGGFETLVAGTAPAFWLFFLGCGIALVVLRRRDASTPRPFRVPGYPWTPLLFCASCVFMLYASLDYARGLAALSLAPLLIGALLERATRRGAPDGAPPRGA